MKIAYKNLTTRQKVAKFIDLLNFVQPEDSRLSHNEVKLLTEFLILPNSRFQYQRFGPRAKKLVIKNLEQQGWKVRYQQVLSYISKIVTKGILYRDEEKVVRIKKSIRPHLDKLLQEDTFNISISLSDGIQQEPNS